MVGKASWGGAVGEEGGVCRGGFGVEVVLRMCAACRWNPIPVEQFQLTSELKVTCSTSVTWYWYGCPWLRAVDLSRTQS